MNKNRLIGLFLMGKRSAHNLIESPLATAPPESVANLQYIQKHASSFITNFLLDDILSQQHYKNYLVSYDRALGYLKQKDYENARIQSEEARSSLVKVDVIPAALAKDFFKITEISNQINENLPKNKH